MLRASERVGELLPSSLGAVTTVFLFLCVKLWTVWNHPGFSLFTVSYSSRFMWGERGRTEALFLNVWIYLVWACLFTLRANKTWDLMKPLQWKISNPQEEKDSLPRGPFQRQLSPSACFLSSSLWITLGIVFVYMAFLPTLQGLYWYEDCSRQSCLSRGIGRVCSWYDRLSPQPISMAKW